MVGKGRGGLEQLASLGGVEEEGQARSGLPPPGPAQRRRVRVLLGDGPVEEAAEDPDEVVDAAGSGPRPGRDERVEQAGSELARVRHATLAGEGEEQAQRYLLRSDTSGRGPACGPGSQRQRC